MERSVYKGEVGRQTEKCLDPRSEARGSRAEKRPKGRMFVAAFQRNTFAGGWNFYNLFRL